MIVDSVILLLFAFFFILGILTHNTRRFDRNGKRNIKRKRSMNTIAREKRTHNSKVLYAKEHVFNLADTKLADSEYLLLAKGLKFVPTPSTKFAKYHLLKDFNELARKIRCKLAFSNKKEDIHPFRTKSGFKPP